MQLMCDDIFNRNFTANLLQCNSWILLKIGQYLAKIFTKVGCHVFMAHSVHTVHSGSEHEKLNNVSHYTVHAISRVLAKYINSKKIAIIRDHRKTQYTCTGKIRRLTNSESQQNEWYKKTYLNAKTKGFPVTTKLGQSR